MKNFLAVGFIFISACSAAEQNRVPECGSMPPVSQLTTVQRQVLAETIRRAEVLCGHGGAGCNFQVIPYEQGQSVISQIAYDPLTYSCVKVKGGNPVYLYDANGKFTGQLPGM